MICASAVSAPTLVASTTSAPFALIVAPITSSPGPTSIGTGSPVTIDASTAERPSTITPSVAIRSPGRTKNRMPTARSATEISRPSIRRAVRTPRSASARMASPERRLARSSSHLPSRISVTITAPVSKYTWPSPMPVIATTSDHASAASEPIDTSVSMVVAPCRRLTAAARWNGQPAPTITTAASTATSHSQPLNCSAGIMEISTAGTVSAAPVTSRASKSARRRRSAASPSSSAITE